jgi:hypothetical protein
VQAATSPPQFLRRKLPTVVALTIRHEPTSRSPVSKGNLNPTQRTEGALASIMRGQLSCAVLLVTCQILLPLVSSDSFHQGGGKAGQQGEWVQCGPITSRKHYEKFVQPPPFTGLNKAIFFSKMGKSTLCEKLAKEYEGELDFAVVSGTPATWATEHLGVDQYPALMLVRYGSKHTLKYGGRFKVCSATNADPTAVLTDCEL